MGLDPHEWIWLVQEDPRAMKPLGVQVLIPPKWRERCIGMSQVENLNQRKSLFDRTVGCSSEDCCFMFFQTTWRMRFWPKRGRNNWMNMDEWWISAAKTGITLSVLASLLSRNVFLCGFGWYTYIYFRVCLKNRGSLSSDGWLLSASSCPFRGYYPIFRHPFVEVNGWCLALCRSNMPAPCQPAINYYGGAFPLSHGWCVIMIIWVCLEDIFIDIVIHLYK